MRPEHAPEQEAFDSANPSLPPPALSVVLTTPDSYDTISRTVAHLRQQTVKDEMELVIVAPSRARLRPVHSELGEFRTCQIVEVGEVPSIGWANAQGVRHATAPIVVLAEDHAYPAADWARALIERHQGPWAAVGPMVRNANPDGLISWADLLMGYAPWLEPAEAGEVPFLPGHNSSYKRSILLEYGSSLEAMMEAETILHWDLRARGHRLFLEPAASVSHTNFSRLSSWIPYLYQAGRVFAGARAELGRWSGLRRLLYACASPLIPVVRLWRALRLAQRQRRSPGLLFTILPALALGLLVDGIGQLTGYAFGTGNARVHMAPFEFHRDLH